MRSQRVGVLLLAFSSACFGGCADDDSSAAPSAGSGSGSGAASASGGGSRAEDAASLAGPRLVSTLSESEAQQLCMMLSAWRLEIFGEDTLRELECVAEGVRASGGPSDVDVAQCEAAAAACEAEVRPLSNICDRPIAPSLAGCDVTLDEYTTCVRASFQRSAATADQFSCATLGVAPPQAQAPAMGDVSMVGLAGNRECAPLVARCISP